MKYKLLVAAAMISLLAAGCNNKVSTSTDNGSASDQNMQQNASASDQTQSMDNSQSGNQSTQNTIQGKTDLTTGNSSASAEMGASDSAPEPEVFEVKMTANGFSPSSITVKAGDYVQFTNDDTQPHWVASNPHPVHTDLPGFDAKQPIAPGSNYRFQFVKVGTWGYHDHLNPSTMGKVIVQ